MQKCMTFSSEMLRQRNNFFGSIAEIGCFLKAFSAEIMLKFNALGSCHLFRLVLGSMAEIRCFSEGLFRGNYPDV
ncbi:MAG: hypothetical protein WCE57_10960 [Salegentibacter sp.]